MRAEPAREKAGATLTLVLPGLLHLLLQLADLLLRLLQRLLKQQGTLGQPVNGIGRGSQAAAQFSISLRIFGLPLCQRQSRAQVLQQLLLLRGHDAFLYGTKDKASMQACKSAHVKAMQALFAGCNKTPLMQ